MNADPKDIVLKTVAQWSLDGHISEKGVTCEAGDAIREAVRAALAAQQAPVAPAEPVAPFLFVQMDDDKKAHVTWCHGEAAVRECVKHAMFFLREGEELSADHAEQLDGSVEELMDSGALTFEGDAPLFLYRMGSAPEVALSAPSDALLRQAGEALDHCLRMLDNVFLDVQLADGNPAWGLIQSRNNGRAAIAAIRAHQAGAKPVVLSLREQHKAFADWFIGQHTKTALVPEDVAWAAWKAAIAAHCRANGYPVPGEGS